MNQVAKTEERGRQHQLADYLQTKADDFKAVMVIEPERFLRMVKNAVLKDPKIAEATTQSVYLECMKAAADGLVLDGREATLTRFVTNKRVQENGRWVDNWQTEVAYIPMVAGIMKRVRNSGEITAWTVGLVYMKEYEQGLFSYTAAPVADLRHTPIIIGDRGPVVAAYSAVRLRDGTMHYEVMRLDELNAIKNRTKSKKTINKGKDNEEIVITGPWATDEEEMFKKTVIRRHSKRLPVSSELLDITQRIDALYDREQEAYVVADLPPEPKPVAAKRAASAAARLKAAQDARDAQARQQAQDVDEDDTSGSDAGDDEGHDPETGEILEGEVIEPEKKTTAKKPTTTPNPEDDF